LEITSFGNVGRYINSTSVYLPLMEQVYTKKDVSLGLSFLDLIYALAILAFWLVHKRQEKADADAYDDMQLTVDGMGVDVYCCGCCCCGCCCNGSGGCSCCFVCSSDLSASFALSVVADKVLARVQYFLCLFLDSFVHCFFLWESQTLLSWFRTCPRSHRPKCFVL
jgi:hypothetical protein